MSAPDLATFDAATVVVTPNNRLARDAVDRYDRHQAALGHRAWPTLRALPWNAWLSSLWLDALAAGAWPQPPALLAPVQVLRLWERAIRVDAPPLFDVAGASTRAASAWATFHAYAAPGETPAQFSGGGDDAAAFARYARRYARSVAEAAACDLATLPRQLVDALATHAFVRGRTITLAGFVDFTPRQRELIEALRGAGALVDVQPAPSRDAARSRAEYRTPADEIVAALQWARARTDADPAARATIAVADLSARLDAVVQLADEILRPQSIASASLAGSKPYEVSLAPGIAGHPLAVAAFDLLELAQRKLPLARVSVLARSPYLAGGAVAAARRAGLEREWRQRNLSDVSLHVLAQSMDNDDPLQDGLARIAQTLRRGAARAPHAWADAFAEALAACGWPGPDPQSSALFQAHEALARAIGEWRALTRIEPRMGAADALSSLRAHCARTPFQPQGSPVRIQILGILEAAGLEFDGLWLAGMDADAWPPRIEPEAFLPVAWQRARAIPQASVEHSLQRAERLTAQLVGSAREVVASHTAPSDPPARRVSALCDWPLVPRPAQPTPTLAAILAARPLVRIDDARLPALPAGSRVKGGVRAIELQSDCAFRAAASLRLRADAWPRPGVGLTAMERGNLVHAAMAALWSTLVDQATLNALDDAALRSRIAEAVTIACATIPEARWRALPPLVADIESTRLSALMFTFLREHEATRPPFRVVGREEAVTLATGGLELGLRIDRIDEVDEGLAVIDYKTGSLPAVRQWLLARPVAPQAGLYALALSQRDADAAVCAAALVSIRSGAFAMRGIASDGARFDKLETPARASQGRIDDFAALLAWWQLTFDGLAADFRAGDAAVLPRDKPRPCAHCDFKPLCRVEQDVVDDGDGDDGQDE